MLISAAFLPTLGVRPVPASLFNRMSSLSPAGRGSFQDTQMNTHPTPNADQRRPRLLTYARCHDAQLFAISADLNDAETCRLRRILDLLVDLGVLAIHRLEAPLVLPTGLDDTLATLRRDLGSMVVEAAEKAAKHPFTPVPKPQSLVPVWSFEKARDNPTLLTAHGLFSGVPIVFEAIHVQDADLLRPFEAVKARFEAWRIAMGPDATPGTCAVPGAFGAYAIFGASHAG